MIAFDPIMKLRLLSVYMSKRIDKMPYHYIDFDGWMMNRYPEFIYGTVHYFREAATHCYYCENKLTKDNIRSIDHFYPQCKNNKEAYEIYVICCQHCNGVKKGGMRPEDFIRKVTVANMKGLQINGFTKKDLSKISANANKIFNDVIYQKPQRVYWLNKGGYLPQGFQKL